MVRRATTQGRKTDTIPVMEEQQMSFWEHLDVLRGVLVRICVATLVCAVAAFCFKDNLFALLLAPNSPDFFLYRLLARIMPDMAFPAAAIEIINTGLADQFTIHIRTACYVGLVCVSPYILYALLRFIAPALYTREKHYVYRLVGWGYLLFMMGVVLSYCVIFPFAFRFLGTYQVSADVVNKITLQSYISTFWTMALLMGLLFELPVVCWTLGQLGLLSAPLMRRYRRHVIVVILILAAVITPTTDVFTLMLVSLPIYFLYEVSVLLVPKS